MRVTRVVSNAPLQYDHVKIQVVATKPSLTFFDAGKIRETGTNVWVDEDEWDVCIDQSRLISDAMTVSPIAEL